MKKRTMGLVVAVLAGATLDSPLHAQTLTLADAARAALDSHPTTGAAQARVDAAEQGLSAARAARLPGASLNASMTRFEEPMVVAPLHGFDPMNPPSFDRTLVQGRAGLMYTLFDGGARGARIQGADAVTEAARHGRTTAEMALLEQVAASYFGVLGARAVQEAAQAQVQAVEAERARAQRHLDAGTAAEVEVLRAEAALQDARAGAATATSRVRLAERRLARLMGASPEEVTGRTLADVEIAADAPSGPVRENPALAGATESLAAARARAEEQRALRLPRVEAGAGLLDFGTLDGGHVTEWQAGLQVSWPLFTGGARGAAIQRAEAEARLAQSQLDLTELELTQAVDAAETAVIEAEARAQALEASVAQWAEVGRIEALALDAGSGVQSDLLRAQASLFQARAGHARARYDALTARVSLARAQGHLDYEWLNATLEIRR